LQSDLLPLLVASAVGGLDGLGARIRPEPCVGVVLASGGYPGSYRTGMSISGLDEVESLRDVQVFHSGTAVRDGQLVTAGGRVLTVVGSGRDYRQAIDVAYDAAGRISFDGLHMRRDIAFKALESSGFGTRDSGLAKIGHSQIPNVESRIPNP
jgi:phosphoribosylamine---glycine ligase